MRQIVHIHNSKTGGGSINELLKNNPRFYEHGHKPIRQVPYEVKINTEAVISCVRNPFDRLISQYHWYKDILPEDKGIFESFHSFIHNYDALREKAEYNHNNYPFFTCFEFLHINGSVDPNIEIIRFENLEEDWNKVAKKYDLPLALPHRHLNPKKPVGYDRAKVYEGGLRELVEDKFRKDLIIWGYSYGSYLKGK